MESSHGISRYTNKKIIKNLILFPVGLKLTFLVMAQEKLKPKQQ
jgi:hypothetical protein